VTNNRSGQ